MFPKEYLTPQQIQSLKLQYKAIYKTIKVNYDSDGKIDNPIYGSHDDCTSRITEFKKNVSVIELCKQLRPDFPKNWTNFINERRNDKQKDEARALFRSGNIQGFLDFLTCLWANNVSFNHYDNVITNLSEKDFGDIFYSSFIRDLLKTNNFSQTFSNMYQLNSDTQTLGNTFLYMQTHFNLLPDNNLLLGEGSKFLINKRTRK